MSTTLDCALKSATADQRRVTCLLADATVHSLVGSEFSFGIIGSNYTADPESTFYASNFYVTNSSGTVPLNDTEFTSQPGISGVYSPGAYAPRLSSPQLCACTACSYEIRTAFEHAPWVSGGFEFTPLNETRYCIQRPALANSSFSIDTASWTPANYDLHYQTTLWTGVNDVEMNFTDPNRVELCITAPYTSACPLCLLFRPNLNCGHKLM